MSTDCTLSCDTITVTAKDANGNPVGGASVVLSQGAGNSMISPALGATTNGSGVATFAVSDTTAENVTYTATADGTLINQSAGVQFQTGADDHLAFLTQPATTGVGQTIAPPVRVEILDVHGNLTSSTASVSLTKHAGSPAGTLSGGGAVSGTGGIATFPSLSIDQNGTGFELDAASGGLTGATSGSFDIAVAPSLAFSGVTGSVYAAAGNTVYFRPAAGA